MLISPNLQNPVGAIKSLRNCKLLIVEILSDV